MTEELDHKTGAAPALRRRGKRTSPRSTAKPVRSVAVFGAVGALVAVIALPAFAPSTQVASATTLQQRAQVEKQSLVVTTEAAAVPLERSEYQATTPEEISEAKAARASLAAGTTWLATAADLALTASGSGEIRYPLPGGSYYVSRSIGGSHRGADMMSAYGTPIYAATAGVVTRSTDSFNTYGVAIDIDGVVGDARVFTRYAHMAYGSRQVQPGDYVTAGQLIGYVSDTGLAFGAHLHFEVYINGGLAEPIAWLRANAG